MNFKTKTAMVLVIALLIAISSFTPAMAEIDSSLVDKAFEKFNELSPSMQNEAIDLLKTYFKSSGTLEVLKQDLPAMLKIVLGDDYETQLAQKGLSIKQLKSKIDELKSWSYEDRMSIIDMAQNNDQDGVKKLLEKYENTETPSSPGTGSGTSQSPSSSSEGQETGNSEQVSTTVAFTDIQNHWAKLQIEYIAEKGIIRGKAEGIFAPEDNITRAEFTAMMVRLLQLENGQDILLPFLDVAEKDWFYETVKSAFTSDLVKGKGDIFDPNGLITREEMVALITRAASLKSKSVPVDSLEIEQFLSPFKDKEEISDWARTETAIALKLGLVRGTSPELFKPKANATRAEAAMVIYNLYGILNVENSTATE